MNAIRTVNWKYIITSLLIGAALSLAAAPVGWAKEDKLPEVDSQGLHLIKDSKVRVAYALPGASLAAYNKVKLLDTYVAFKKNYQRDYNLQEVGLEGRVTDKDLEGVKTRLAAEFTKEFTKVLTKKGYPVVDETGPDVLLLRPAIINLNVAAPDTMRGSAMSATIVRSAGDMTLYMELYDSATSKLIARVIDPQTDYDGFAERANRVTNKAAADQIIGRWATLLAKRLDEAKESSAGK